MQFEKFGNKGYVSSSKINGFVEALANGKIMGANCRKCGEFYFPPRSDCATCLSQETELREIDPNCELLEFADVPLTEKHERFVVGLAKLREGPKVMARIPVDQASGLKVGAKMKLLPVTYPDGQLSYELRK
ncbi:MAG: Zn-ribbon domain-containing OB-fold protein [Nitrososphaerales archaeon]